MGCKLKHGDLPVGMEGEGYMGEHGDAEVSHNRISLYMQIPQYFICAPAAKQADNVRVDVGIEESHGSGGVERSSRNVRWKKAIGRTEDDTREAEYLGDFSWGYVVTGVGEVRGQGSGGWGTVSA